MAVYVDSARIPYGRMKMCHMLADTIEELHAMADAIGLKREWFQGDSSAPHYDVCWTKRGAALLRGALPADRKKVVELVRKHRGGEESRPECVYVGRCNSSRCPAHGNPGAKRRTVQR
jgi:hypothetical protein